MYVQPLPKHSQNTTKKLISICLHTSIDRFFGFCSMMSKPQFQLGSGYSKGKYTLIE